MKLRVILLFLIAIFSVHEALSRVIKTNSNKVLIEAAPPANNGIYTTQTFTGAFAIVYVRVPRTVGGSTRPEGTTIPSVPVNGQFDAFPETSHWVNGMSGPGQLVYRDRSGVETILFDCIGKTKMPIVNGVPVSPARECLPMDPTVSFDGTKVVFSVLYSTFLDSNYQVQTSANTGSILSKIATNSVGAQLFEADLTTFQVRALDYKRLGDFDTAPVYIPWNESDPSDMDRIMFTSNRARELPSSLMFTSTAATAFNSTLLQLYIADKDAKNARRVGVHDRDGILHPFVMSDGRVLFTTWSLSHMQPYKKNNAAARNGAAPQNESWIASVNSKGGFFTAEYGRHGKYRVENGSAKGSVGLHFFTESSDRRWICSDDYYRSNNMGGGLTTCYQREAVGVEGPYTMPSYESAFMPRFILNAFNFGSNSDVESANGGTRDPMGLPGNHLMVTWLKGNACLRPDVARYVFTTTSSCDTGIYRTTSFPSFHTGLQKIVDDPNYHEFMARVAEPYSFVYGIPKPKFAGHQRVANNGKCYLGSSSLMGEVEPLSPYSFNSSGKSSQDCALQGCKARAVGMDQVAAIRFWEVLPNDEKFLVNAPYYSTTAGQPNFLKSLVGNRLKLLGDAPVKGDGSFVAEIPCDTPYVMAGVSGDGEVILRDQVPQSLRPGEIRTCTGCHLHSGKTGPAFETSASGLELDKHLAGGATGIAFIGAGGGYREMWKRIMRSQLSVDSNGVSTEVAEGRIYEYNRDIVPILNASCVRCHGAQSVVDLRETGAKADNFADLPAQHEQTVYLPSLLWANLTTRRPALAGDWEVPRLSKYIHMGFAVESLFYWKTAGARKDGRLDSTLVGDLDYGTPSGTDPHAGINQDHVRIIKNWIDSGSYLHQGNLPIDYKPVGN